MLQRSRAEQELLDIGAAFSDALQSYANATPAGFPPQPPSLKELLKDPRFPTVRRHLRKVFVDPMTGKAEWGITYLGDKVGVLAVYSLSDAKPVKIGNFPQRFQGLAGKQKISEWRFAASGGTLPAPGQNQQPGAVEVKPGMPPGSPPAPVTPPGSPPAPVPPPDAPPAPEPPEEEKPAMEPEPPAAPPQEPPQPEQK